MVILQHRPYRSEEEPRSRQTTYRRQSIARRRCSLRAASSSRVLRMPTIADRVLQLGTETALDVLLKARAIEARGRSVIHLEVGEPDFPTPAHIVEAGVRALRDGHTRYGPPAGLPELREAICQALLEIRGVCAVP